MDLPPSGVLGRLGLRGKVRVEPEEDRLVVGGEVLRVSELRFLEVQQGYLTVGTADRWLTIDLTRRAGPGGPLVAGGALSPAAVELVETLRAAIERNGEDSRAAGAASPSPVLSLRYRIRLDPIGIVLTVASVAILLWDLHRTTQEWHLSFSGLLWFLAFLALGSAALIVKRRAEGLRIDSSGVTRTGLLGTRFHPWPGIQEVRRQHAEVELVGQGFRAPVSLDLLAAGNTPLILRRGRYRFVSPPGRLLLTWLREKAPEKVLPPLALSAGERWRARLWIGVVVALNAAAYIASTSGPEQDLRDRLVRLGARTGDWAREPWRLFTSLFLHASLSHFLFNMLMLAVLAPWMGRIFGWWRATALYVLGGFLGNLSGELFLIWGAEHGPAVGASTAIMGLLGALLGATHHSPESVPLAARVRFRWAIPVTLLLILGLGLVIPVIDNAAHLGGFLWGLALSWLFPPAASRRGGA